MEELEIKIRILKDRELEVAQRAELKETIGERFTRSHRVVELVRN